MVLALPLLLAQAASGQPAAPLVPDRRPGNVLIVVADDLGVDQVAAYGEGVEVPWTPNVDRLAQEGVLFRNAYANPFCSPTRAALLTGRHAFRTGMGTYMIPGEAGAFALQPSEVTLPEMVAQSPRARYATAAIGKWHLGNETVGGPLAPNLAGFDRFAGIEGNIKLPQTYYAWPKVVDGVTSTSTTYATTDAIDEALAWIAGAPEPWMVYLAFSAIHTPLHVPPPGSYVVDLSTADPHLNPRPYYVAAAEALDLELGRLLDGLGPELDRTHVIFLGDNGSPKDMVLPPIPQHQHKGTPYEGGIGVPLIVRGPAVEQPGSEVAALVQATDVYATVAELVGVDLAGALPPSYALDSISLLPYLGDPGAPPLRATAFSETFAPNGFGPYTGVVRAIRDAQHKLIVEEGQPPRLFDLLADPHETVDLLEGTPTPEALAAYQALQAALDALLAS